MYQTVRHAGYRGFKNVPRTMQVCRLLKLTIRYNGGRSAKGIRISSGANGVRNIFLGIVLTSLVGTLPGRADEPTHDGEADFRVQAQPGKGSALRVEMGRELPGISYLSWDTEGGNRLETNLLRSGKLVTLRLRQGGQWKSAVEFPAERITTGTRAAQYRLTITPESELNWTVSSTASRLTMKFSATGSLPDQVDGLELVFPFDPRQTPTTVIPSRWADNGELSLPAIISAPDFGQMILADSSNRQLTARLEGSRSDKSVDLIVQLPVLRANRGLYLGSESFSAVNSGRSTGHRAMGNGPARLVRSHSAEQQVG